MKDLPPPHPRVLPTQVQLSSAQPSTADPPCSNPHVGGCVLQQPPAPTPGLYSLDIASASKPTCSDSVRGGGGGDTVLARLVSDTGDMSSSTFEFNCMVSCPYFKLETIASVKAFTLEFRVAILTLRVVKAS